MTSVLKGVQPERVLFFFEEISGQIRGSGHEKPISDYLFSFAKEREYDVWQDELYNIFIKVPGVSGGENSDPVVLHGHMDMVWNVAEGVVHDFFNDPLDLYIDNEGYLRAHGTTLGADNGIGVAYMLALIEDDSIPHPPLECVITVMEEMGKKGLSVFDTSRITAKRMIDFNWIDDKQILVGCSGDLSLRIAMPTEWEVAPAGFASLIVKILNLKGGHCEWDIHAERGNSIILMARLLNTLQREYDIRLINFEGGVQNNVIPSNSIAELFVPETDKQKIIDNIKEFERIIQKEYEIADPNLKIEVQETSNQPEKIINPSNSRNLYKLIHLIPNGMLKINLKVRKLEPFSEVVDSCGGFPTELDNNLGILRIEDDEIWMITTITSAVTSLKHDLYNRIVTIVELIGHNATIEVFGVDAPEFPYNPNSRMSELAFEAYKESYGYEPELEVSCCSLQLGMLIQQCDLDCVGLGTEIHDVHSAKEAMKISSVENSWKMIKNLMQKLIKE